MHFSSPVTLQFSYSSDSVQLPELVGVAYQDTDNTWYSMPDYSVDSISHTVSATIGHFSDWTDFERVRIHPSQATLWVNQTLYLELAEWDCSEGGNQPQQLYRVTNDQVTWSASAGTISGQTYPLPGVFPATFRAPASIPAGNPVRVSATVNHRFTYHGTIVPTNRTVFFSYVTITDSSASYHVELYFNNPNYMVATLAFTLSDTCGFDVTVGRRSSYISNITNHQPGVTPTSAQAGECTLTWVPGGPGPMNVTSWTVSLDASGYVNVGLIHNAYEESFRFTCPGEPPILYGGTPLAGGDPGGVSFLSTNAQSHFPVSALVWAVVTRQ
jgi:hypothetical protein